MHMITIALIISFLGMVASFGFVGIIPSILAFVLNIFCLTKEKSINTVRSLAISIVGIILPIIMFYNSYGFDMPYDKGTGLSVIPQILYDNYLPFGVNLGPLFGLKENESENYILLSDNSENLLDFDEDENVSIIPDAETALDNTPEENLDDSKEIDEKPQSDLFSDIGSLFSLTDENVEESIDSLDESEKDVYGADKVGASDDSMPSYGGLPIGVSVVGQYFREDDHNCNPVIVLKNDTGDNYRFECIFTARDEEGNSLAISEKTVETVPNGALFIFEGRFDKNELGGTLPSMYEFLISKRKPYVNDMYEDATVISKVIDNSVLLTAQNHSDKEIKVDAYVLFFDKDELVDCIWMIPRNAGAVAIEPESFAAIKADAYYRFDRIETYYTAYEVVGE